MTAAKKSDAVYIGKRLRNVREQQNLSLQDVEERSQGEFKASVVGAYERDNRSISLSRLNELAKFYRVPIIWFFPVSSTDSL